MSVTTELGPSFEIARDIKERALSEAAVLRLELEAARANVALLETMLDNTALKLQEAQNQLELTKADRTYWQGQYDQLAKEQFFVYAMLGEIKAFTAPR